MRDVMRTDGGSCASGGPYVTARQCSGGEVRLLLIGILAGLACAAVYAASTTGLGQSAATAGLLAWTALFALLGWNFISLGRHPGAGQAASSGWLVSGVVFWNLALGGLTPALIKLASGLRAAGRPAPTASVPQPLVRAAIPPGLAGWLPTGLGGWSCSTGGLSAGIGGLSDGTGRSAAGGIRLQAPPGRATAIVSASAWLSASLAGVATGLAISWSLISLLK